MITSRTSLRGAKKIRRRSSRRDARGPRRRARVAGRTMIRRRNGNRCGSGYPFSSAWLHPRAPSRELLTRCPLHCVQLLALSLSFSLPSTHSSPTYVTVFSLLLFPRSGRLRTASAAPLFLFLRWIGFSERAQVRPRCRGRSNGSSSEPLVLNEQLGPLAAQHEEELANPSPDLYLPLSHFLLVSHLTTTPLRAAAQHKHCFPAESEALTMETCCLRRIQRRR